jgi:hypothetical protein
MWLLPKSGRSGDDLAVSQAALPHITNGVACGLKEKPRLWGGAAFGDRRRGLGGRGEVDPSRMPYKQPSDEPWVSDLDRIIFVDRLKK